MINFKNLAQAYNQFSPQELPFLTESRQKLADEKPYRGMRILHNTPIALITVCKIECLLLGGAEVVVTCTKGFPPEAESIKILHDAKVDYQATHEFDGEFDMFLDCCADLLVRGVPPRKGAGELTQTGSLIYQKSNLTYPVISVDNTKIKHIENFYGTGDGFIRGFLMLTKEKIQDKKFVVFGYGKVGRGVVRALQEVTNKIVIIENNETALLHAEKNKIEGISINNKSAIKQHLKDAFCVIAATGVKNVISDHFDKNDFSGKYLAQLGVVDEFGNKFTNDEVLFQKKAINFALKEPTRVRFLDPVFYAHNLVIDQIASGDLPSGFHEFPKDLDEEILQRWANFHQQDVADLF